MIWILIFRLLGSFWNKQTESLDDCKDWNDPDDKENDHIHILQDGSHRVAHCCKVIVYWVWIIEGEETTDDLGSRDETELRDVCHYVKHHDAVVGETEIEEGCKDNQL